MYVTYFLLILIIKRPQWTYGDRNAVLTIHCRSRTIEPVEREKKKEEKKRCYVRRHRYYYRPG